MKGSADEIRKTSNRLKHGLSSRIRQQALRDDAVDLAKELIWHESTTDEILDTATDLAQTILLLQAIKAERRKVLSTPAPPTHYEEFLADENFEDFRQEVLHSGFCEDPPPEEWARNLMLVVRYSDLVAQHEPSLDDIPRLLRSRKSELRRLDDYERRARSRRMKLSNRLDYLIIEAARQSEMPAISVP